MTSGSVTCSRAPPTTPSTRCAATASGFILGLAAVGYLQASVTLMGPMTILFLGMGLVTIPEGARALRRSHRHLRIFCVLVSAGLTVAELGWGLILLVAVPRGLGSAVARSHLAADLPARATADLLPHGPGAWAPARAPACTPLGAAKRSLRYRTDTAAISSAFTLGGAVVWGVKGAAFGMAVGAWIARVHRMVAIPGGTARARSSRRPAGSSDTATPGQAPTVNGMADASGRNCRGPCPVAAGWPGWRCPRGLRPWLRSCWPAAPAAAAHRHRPAPVPRRTGHHRACPCLPHVGLRPAHPGFALAL